jgi:hypothetical protein
LFGHRRMLEAFAEFLTNEGIGGPSVRPHKTIYTIGTTCRPAEGIIALLYTDATIALRRKAEIAARILAGTDPA